jgi:L-threonylcarbamoyladenylate synthase
MLHLRVNSSAPEPEALARAVEILRLGGVVAYPTDTLYGLAVDPRSSVAVARLFEIKGRQASVAVPLIAADLEQAEAVGSFGATERRLAREFWPGPLTIVVPASSAVSAAALGGGDTVAVRVPAHVLARTLARVFEFCITATSANVSGEAATGRAAEVRAALGEGIDLLLDGGDAPGGLPSTIVRIDRGRPALLRAGAIAWERVLESLP